MRIEDIKEYEIKEHRFLNDINTDAYVLFEFSFVPLHEEEERQQPDYTGPQNDLN